MCWSGFTEVACITVRLSPVYHWPFDMRIRPQAMLQRGMRRGTVLGFDRDPAIIILSTEVEGFPLMNGCRSRGPPLSLDYDFTFNVPSSHPVNNAFRALRSVSWEGSLDNAFAYGNMKQYFRSE